MFLSVGRVGRHVDESKLAPSRVLYAVSPRNLMCDGLKTYMLVKRNLQVNNAMLMHMQGMHLSAAHSRRLVTKL